MMTKIPTHELPIWAKLLIDVAKKTEFWEVNISTTAEFLWMDWAYWRFKLETGENLPAVGYHECVGDYYRFA